MARTWRNGPRNGTLEGLTMRFLVLILAVGTVALPTWAAQYDVDSDAALRQALARLEPGDRVVIAPGDYAGGLYLAGVSGTAEAPVVIGGAEDVPAPRFAGAAQAFHLVDCNHVTLRRMRVEGCTANGINADDGGSYDTPARGLVFEGLTIENTGPRGNHDALKLSGLSGFTVRDCTFRGWGGSGVDLVGCHEGLITGCDFVGLDGFSQSNGVQIKGGSSGIRVVASYFENAGDRGINLGGSTGLAFFRPQDADCEARDVEVAGNVFVGGNSAVGWVSADGGYVHHNTIVRPARWALRLLQESVGDRFVPCRDGVFEHNLVVYGEKLRTMVNVGPNTAPETFTFRGNAWFDASGRARRPELPVAETGGFHGVDPGLVGEGRRLRPGLDDPRLAAVGAHAWK